MKFKNQGAIAFIDLNTATAKEIFRQMCPLKKKMKVCKQLH